MLVQVQPSLNMLLLKNYNIKKYEQHPFHMVDISPWPIMTSISLLSLVLGFISYFHYFNNGSYHFIISFLIVCFYLFRWFSDIVTESTFEGNHTFKVQNGIRLGMCLFIASEVMFFFSFFWGYFHCSLSPCIGIGCIWPPKYIITLDAWGLPLWNTIILLSSGITITSAHRGILVGDRLTTTNSLVATILYGTIFTFIQAYEYNVAPFSINDGIFGSLFFLLTGFHGLHVLIGTIFLIICLYRQINYHFTKRHHIGFEAGIWYWHFVDVVWLFLFIVIYIWGG
jgi:cytochrome c oxidase subunit 3